jgi:hypothetical protein
MVILADFDKQKQYFVKKIIALSQYRFIAISQYCLQTSVSDEGLNDIKMISAVVKTNLRCEMYI